MFWYNKQISVPARASVLALQLIVAYPSLQRCTLSRLYVKKGQSVLNDELVMAATARLLRQTGMQWRPQVGDWCGLIDGLHTSGAHGGLWLVVDANPEFGWIAVIDAAAQWSPSRIALRDALWLPTIGQMKGWLRGAGYLVTTTEGIVEEVPTTPVERAAAAQGWAAEILGVTSQPALPQSLQHTIYSHHCTVTRTTNPPVIITGDGSNEAEAIADTIFHVLTHDERRYKHQNW